MPTYTPFLYSSQLPLYNMANLTYLGAFRLTGEAGVGRLDFSGASVAHRPPNGSNGTYGSIFMSVRTELGSQSQQDDVNIGEWEIPDTLDNTASGTGDALPTATQLQNIVRVESTTAGDNGTDTTSSLGHNIIGTMHVTSDDRLIVYHMPFYAGVTGEGWAVSTRTDKSVSIFSNAGNLSAGGSCFHTFGAPRDSAGLYISPVPTNYQSILGGTHVFGSGSSTASFDPRCSHGPALYTGNPNTFATGQLSLTQHLMYEDGYPLARAVPSPAHWKGTDTYTWDAYRQTQMIHYLSNFGDTSINENVDGNPCFLAYRNWIESAAPGSRVDWNTLAAPTGIINDYWAYTFSFVALGFIVPGTRTFLCMGHDSGMKFGGGYKFPLMTSATWTATGGQSEIDPDDVYTSAFWAYDMDDIIGATNAYDPFPYAYGQNPDPAPAWNRRDYPGSKAKSKDGFFDPTTNRVYITRAEVEVGSFSSHPVIEVYQV